MLQDYVTLPHVSHADSSAVLVRLQARDCGVPSDNSLIAVATYASPSGEPRTTTLKASTRHCPSSACLAMALI